MAARLPAVSIPVGILKMMAIIFPQRQGKQIWYEPAPDRVRYQHHANGRFSLTLTGREGGVEVTVGVGERH